jgi:hypothetical protein
VHPGVGGSAEDERDAARETVAQKLRELPNEAPPPFDWSELQRRVRTKRARDRGRREIVTGRRQAGPSRALAVSVGVTVIAAALLIASGLARRAGELARMRPEAGRVQPVQPGARPSGNRGLQAEELLARAEGAERWLTDRPEDAAVVQVNAHLAIANLEDRVAAMDDLLNLERLQHSRSSRLRALQLQRAQLVDSLAQVRYAEMLVEETP